MNDEKFPHEEIMPESDTIADGHLSEGFWRGAGRRFRRDRVGVASALFVLVLVLAPIVFPLLGLIPGFPFYHYAESDYAAVREGPSWHHWAGCDSAGRDIFSRVVYSLRTALLISFSAVLINVLIGGLIGVLAGYRGGTLDLVLMRVTDVMFAFPGFLFNLILVAALGRGVFTIIVALSVTGWAAIARLMRGQILAIKQREYVEAARALGAGELALVGRYILPNALPPLLVAISFAMPQAMMIESGLSVLGLGVRPPMPSWGALITDGINYVRFLPHVLLFPAISFAITLLAFTYLGDALQHTLNPRGDR